MEVWPILRSIFNVLQDPLDDGLPCHRVEYWGRLAIRGMQILNPGGILPDWGGRFWYRLFLDRSYLRNMLFKEEESLPLTINLLASLLLIQKQIYLLMHITVSSPLSHSPSRTLSPSLYKAENLISSYLDKFENEGRQWRSNGSNKHNVHKKEEEVGLFLKINTWEHDTRRSSRRACSLLRSWQILNSVSIIRNLNLRWY